MINSEGWEAKLPPHAHTPIPAYRRLLPQDFTELVSVLSRVLPSAIGILAALLVVSCSSPEPAAPIEGIIERAGATIYTKTMGSGAPILVVHGGPGLDHSYFLPYLEPLADDYQLIFYDQRASGRSSAGDSSAFTLDGFVADLEAVRAASGNERVHVLAHSWGAILALNYAMEHMDRVTSLVMVNPIAASTELQQAAALRLRERITPADSAITAQLMATPAFRQREPQALRAYFKMTFRPSFYDPDNVDKMELWFDERFAENSGMLRLLGADPAFMSYDLHSRLSALTLPVLVLFGVHDAVVAGRFAAHAGRFAGCPPDTTQCFGALSFHRRTRAVCGASSRVSNRDFRMRRGLRLLTFLEAVPK